MNDRKQISNEVTIVGGGLAGVEAAWQLAQRGVRVALYEMRPLCRTSAHNTEWLGELVCSNSLGADQPTSSGGILKEELRRLGSLVLATAEKSRVPAGKALAVDRDAFAGRLTREMDAHPFIRVVREEVCSVPQGAVILATGPLTSRPLADSLKSLVGEDFLSFFDAAAPIVTVESIDPAKSYRAGRYGQREDYINCPLSKMEYDAFVQALISAERAIPHAFESEGESRYFEGCLPVEVLASRGVETLRFGPMRPVGLPDPETGKEPWALVQLRQDNQEGTLFNLVGFQTSLRWGEQDRVFRMIPALENADFVRKGVMHRNLFLCAPRVLDGFLRLRDRKDLFFAGQMCGVEGYVESTAMGLVSALWMFSLLQGGELPLWPRETAIGSLLYYLVSALPQTFQPMNTNLGIFPPLEQRVKKKSERCAVYAERSHRELELFLQKHPEYAAVI